MAYICQDCTYKANKRFPEGRCPACGSFNIRSDRSKEDVKQEKDKKTPLEIFIMVLVWGVLIWGVWDRYFSG